MSEIWYRYEERHYAPPVDEFDNICGPGRTEVVLIKYSVIRHTPKGVWLSIGRFVLHGARKRYACPTEKEARESFLARKKRQLRILNHQVLRVTEAIQKVDKPANTIDFSVPTRGPL